MSNYYTVYLNNTDEVVAFGTSKECAAQLHKSINGFHSLVSKNRNGIHHKYTIIIDPCTDKDDLDEPYIALCVQDN